MVGERCTIVTFASLSHRSTQMSWAELPEPMTTHCLPANGAPVVNALEWNCSPRKESMPGKRISLGGP